MQHSDSKFNFEYNKLNTLAIQKVRNNHTEEAVEILLEAINKNKRLSKAYVNLSNIYIIKREHNKALKILKEYSLSYNYNIEILDHHYKICKKLNLEDDFFNFLKSIGSKDNIDNRYFYYYLIAKQYTRKDNYTKSISFFIKSLEDKTLFINAYNDLFDYLERINKIKYLEKLLNKYKIENKNNIIFKYFESLILNRTNYYFESDKIIKDFKLEKELINNKKYYLKVIDLIIKNNEKLKNYKKVLSTIDKRNKFLNKLDEYKGIPKEDLSIIIKHYKKVYNKENYNKKSPLLNKITRKKINIVFLVGFPRSGTTLLDTILMTKKNVVILKEKPYLRKIRDKFFSKNNNDLYSILNISEDDILNSREFYLEQLKSDNINYKDLIIDKLPLTITELGFVKLIFPEAKIILALRHPCDTVFSCYATFFKPNQAMINFLNLNTTIKFYDSVFNLFEFYEKELNLDYIIIKYENVVNNFEKEITKLLNYLDLSYEKNLKNFYLKAKERGVISTPSYSQVSKPIYKSSIDRWKNYEEFIKIEKSLTKWIKKFNY